MSRLNRLSRLSAPIASYSCAIDTTVLLPLPLARWSPGRHLPFGSPSRALSSTASRACEDSGDPDHHDHHLGLHNHQDGSHGYDQAHGFAHRCGRPPAAIVPPPQPFRFDTGVAMFAKRTPRPFPPPFYSPPTDSFSDALSTHHLSRDPRHHAMVDGQLLGGCTNGDDAVYASQYFVAANDGVGAWSTRPRGHAGLWARLIAHFWADAVYADLCVLGDSTGSDTSTTPATSLPDPVRYLQQAYEQAIEATQPPNDWQGTTTTTGAQLWHHRPAKAPDGPDEPLLFVTNLGDSQVMVVRPTESLMVFKTKEQWHWFDCPRQLGTNSPDTPRENAVVDTVPIRVGDVVLAMSDGVIDNLWPHEIVDRVSRSVAAWLARDKTELDLERGMMAVVAEELVEAARVIAVDPFAESPFMEHAVEEGLPSEGGKLDDISVVAAICRRNDQTV